MEKSTISQAMLKVSELERIYRDKMYKMMDLENIIQEFIGFIKEKNNSNKYIEDALKTHKICEDIVNYI